MRCSVYAVIPSSTYHLRKDRYNDGLTYWAIRVEYFYWYPALLLRQGPSGKSCSLLSHYLRCHNRRNKQQPTPTITSIHLTSARARGQTDWYQLVAGVGDILPNTSDLRPGVTDPRWCWAEMIHYSQICSLVWTTETCFKSIFSFYSPPPPPPPPRLIAWQSSAADWPPPTNGSLRRWQMSIKTVISTEQPTRVTIYFLKNTPAVQDWR